MAISQFAATSRCLGIARAQHALLLAPFGSGSGSTAARGPALTADEKGGPHSDDDTPLWEVTSGTGARELLDHVAAIANIPAHQNARSVNDPALPPTPELERGEIIAPRCWRLLGERGRLHSL